MPPENKDPQPIDPKSLLLPKKEAGPTPDTAQRINAGQLLAQEQNATLANEPKGVEPAPPKDAGANPVQTNGLVEATETPTRGPSAVPDSSPALTVAPLQTYKSDVEKVVIDKNVSVVDIAAAEANRRAEQGSGAPKEPIDWKPYAMYGGGGLLVVLAIALGAFVFLRDTALPKQAELQAPYISVDSYQLLQVPDTANRNSLNDTLQIARQNSKLSLGLIDWLYPMRSGVGGASLNALDFLTTLTPNVPSALQRTLEPVFLLGLHSFDENQAFLLLRADAYTTAYAAMLEWERTLKGDLGPLFVRNPSPAPQAPAAQPLSTTTPAVVEQPVFVQSSFVDKIVENRDVRALLDERGSILLLWTMLGRNIILITTNEYTLREVVSRINTAPTIPQPGQ